MGKEALRYGWTEDIKRATSREDAWRRCQRLALALPGRVALGLAIALMLRLDEIAGERMSRAAVSTQRASGQQPARQTATYEYPSVNGEAKNQTEIRHAAY